MSGSGWSVIVIGAVERITRPADIDRLARLDLPTWLAGQPLHWMRIRARTISGRRLARAGGGEAH